jgi:hypothetical protein
MRRFTVGLAIVLALFLMLAAVAIAAPPDFCTNHPDNPNCTTTTDGTSTTVPSDVPLCDNIPLLGGPGRTSFECVWTPDEPTNIAENLEGTVTVDVTDGEVSGLVVSVRDSAPGDICVLMQEWPDQLGPVFTTTFPLADVARGTNYWDFGGTHWCEPYDPIAGPREDLNGKPLHVNVGFVGKKNTVVGTMRFDTADNAKTFFRSKDLKATMAEAGVMEKPEIWMVEDR